jgi:hypothetical protein
VKKLLVTAFVASSAAGFLLAYPSSVLAKWQRIAPSICQVEAYYGYYPLVGMSATTGLRVEDTTDIFAYVMCNIDDSDAYGTSEVAVLKVHVIDRSSSYNVTAQACRVDYTSTGGSCGGSASSSGSSSAVQILQPSLAKWTATGMGYVYVEIPPKVGSNASSLMGLYTSDT